MSNSNANVHANDRYRCGCTQEIAIGRGRKKHVYTWKCVEVS